MRILPPAPSPGDRVSATLLRELIRYIRASTPIAGTGLKSRVSPNGTTLSVVPQASKAAAADKGCWRIVAETIEVETDGETATSTVHYIDRQYYQAGGILQQGSDRTTLESLVEASTPFVAARIAYGTADGSAELSWYGVQIHGYAGIADMIADSLNRHYSVLPLYELKLPEPSGESGQESGESGQEDDTPPPIVVVTDFRAIPVAQAFEMPTEGE